jgi:hypothetical protein
VAGHAPRCSAWRFGVLDGFNDQVRFETGPTNQGELRLFKETRRTAIEVPAWGGDYPSFLIPKDHAPKTKRNIAQ